MKKTLTLIAIAGLGLAACGPRSETVTNDVTLNDEGGAIDGNLTETDEPGPADNAALDANAFDANGTAPAGNSF